MSVVTSAAASEVTDVRRGNPADSIATRRATAPTRWHVWLSWVGHTMTGVVLGAALVTTVLAHGGVALTPLAGVGGFVLVGVAQWLVLRRYRPAIRWYSWIAATIVGQVGAAVAGLLVLMTPALLALLRAVSSPFGASAVPFATTVVIGALAGGIGGFATWLALRRHFAGSGVWILAAALAGAVGALLPTMTNVPALLEVPLAPIVARIATGFVTACATGLVLAWLVRPADTGGAHAVTSRDEEPASMGLDRS